MSSDNIGNLIGAVFFFVVGYGLGYSSWQPEYGDRSVFAVKFGAILALVAVFFAAILL